jgi:uncharacterized protein
MDTTKTHGAFSWSELSTSDPAAAVAFYSKLFGWKAESMGAAMGDYQIVKVGDTPVAGIMKTPAEAAGMPPMWGCYVTVNNVEQTMSACVALGGKVLVPAMDVPGVGRMAVLQDPQGACLSVMTYAAG